MQKNQKIPMSGSDEKLSNRQTKKQTKKQTCGGYFTRPHFVGPIIGIKLYFRCHRNLNHDFFRWRTYELELTVINYISTNDTTRVLSTATEEQLRKKSEHLLQNKIIRW